MQFNHDLVEEIRSKCDIVDIIGKYVHLEKKGNSYMGLCPFHNEKSPSFSVSKTNFSQNSSAISLSTIILLTPMHT